MAILKGIASPWSKCYQLQIRKFQREALILHNTRDTQEAVAIYFKKIFAVERKYDVVTEGILYSWFKFQICLPWLRLYF